VERVAVDAERQIFTLVFWLRTTGPMYAQKKSIQNVHIVRERDRRRFRELLAVLSLGIPICLFLLLFTWQNIEVISLGREATRLRAVKRELESENERLRFQIEQMTSLEAAEARETAAGLRRSAAAEVVDVAIEQPRSAGGDR
jgi:hypothetical protein